jgi:hypothetical protein
MLSRTALTFVLAGAVLFGGTTDVEVKAIENGKPITVTAQVRSVMHLGPKLPEFYLGRVKGTPELKAEDMRHLGDPSTVGWID